LYESTILEDSGMYEDELTVALLAARTGAAVVREHFGVAVRADYKSDANPVTAVDRSSEEQVLKVLRTHYPDDAVLAEESGGSGSIKGRVWLVDPLDGTVNFVHSIPHVAVSVALWIDGAAVVGVVIDPLRQEEFSASQGGGSYLGEHRMAVSTEPNLSQSLIATGFPYDRNLYAGSYAANLGAVLGRAQGIRRMGSAALDLAWVAAGLYDGYWEFALQAWDVAAGVLLVAEAGGAVSNARGASFQLNDMGVVVSNGHIHDELLTAVQSTIPEHLL
jgi:myo-inositol-1(or 4)-monophosphatase